MKSRTQKQDEAAWRHMNATALKKGWHCVGGWKFQSPSNTVHDLSASCPTKLDYIEANRIGLV